MPGGKLQWAHNILLQENYGRSRFKDKHLAIIPVYKYINIISNHTLSQQNNDLVMALEYKSMTVTETTTDFNPVLSSWPLLIF